MKFNDIFFSKENRYSLGTELQSGKHYLSIPVSYGIVDYEEYYEIDSNLLQQFQTQQETALEFAQKCRRQELDELLIVKPGSNRGIG
ncbi:MULTISPECIES: hypothetical protein [unclassified Pseudomonas]|uniref:hypothetical protein n=1 Tax=unclassified Pseudomonas TaxID=196821 RepID=UPI00385A2E81